MTTNIEHQVMAGVGIVHTARRLTSRMALEVYALALSFWSVVYFVSLPHVFANLFHAASGGVPSIEAFTLSAVLGTTTVVQIALLIGTVALVSLALNTLRAVTQTSRLA